MIIIETIQELRAEVKARRLKSDSIGFVPTMGSLHKGHLSLIEASKRECEVTIVSIFVNPTQFGPGEDFKQYPRDVEKDREMLEGLEVDILFCPAEKEVYPERSQTIVMLQSQLIDSFEGYSRPGHFGGVALVVCKLFNMVLPDKAFFGQKDAQQARVIYQMVIDLNIPVEVVTMPIVREADGLAMSSRNQRLSKEGRAIASSLYEGLKEGANAIRRGEKDPMQVMAMTVEHLTCFSEIETDYVAIVDPFTFEEVETINKSVLILAAVFLDGVRLIDNYFVEL